MSTLFNEWRWQPPAPVRRISTIEMHTGGEPLRIFTDGMPELPGETVLEKRRYFRDHYDHLRKATMWEPRGHADMYGAVDLPAFFGPVITSEMRLSGSLLKGSV